MEKEFLHSSSLSACRKSRTSVKLAPDPAIKRSNVVLLIAVTCRLIISTFLPLMRRVRGKKGALSAIFFELSVVVGKPDFVFLIG